MGTSKNMSFVHSERQQGWVRLAQKEEFVLATREANRVKYSEDINLSGAFSVSVRISALFSFIGPISRSGFLGNILFVPFCKGIHRGENTSHIDQVDLGLDPLAPMIFTKILPEELIDMAR